MRSVSSDEWRRLQQVLDGALSLPAEERRAYLDRACATDASLASDVESLLEACGRAGEFLEHPPSQLAAALLAAQGVADTGSSNVQGRAGPYRVVGEVGRGGMGVVYLAERDDGQFRQRVALKLLPRGFETEQALHRFREERQILASLNHPGIARLLDGGVTDDGLPYFAMEYVEGTPIDRWCDERALDVPARLQLFIDVCEAVQYAHQNLVVHRDLKPTNILVAAPGSSPAERGSVKLLDFGVAKLLSSERSSDALGDALPASNATGDGAATGSRWLTPRYASPEQLRGAPVTTVSDVYTLGVLLYELLTGRWPYRLSAGGLMELERVICEHEPETPSVTVASDARLARRLRGDLDTIVLTAMQKVPARRYSSAEALADDLGRHIAGLPVRARPDTLRYRASRFVRRHRLAVAAASALALSLVAGAAGTAWQGAAAARERDRARQEAATAARASALLVDMFRLADPDVTRGATITAREVLARGARRIEVDFASNPALQATMLRELGRIYQNLGIPDDAERLVSRAVELRRQDGPSAELAAGVHQLGEIDAARARFPSAERHFREAAAMRRATTPASDGDIAATLRGLAHALGEQRKHAAAESLYQEVLAIDRRLHGPRSREAAASLYALAVSFHDRGNFADAEPLFRESIDIYRGIPGTRDPAAASARLMLASVMLFRERYAEAEPMLRESLALRRTIYGPEHPETLMALTALGTLLHNTSRFGEGEAVMREAHHALLRQKGPTHPDVLTAKQILGATLVDQGRHEEAEPLYRETLAGWQTYGSDRPNGVFTRHLLAESELARGALDAARANFAEVVAAGRRLSGPTHTYVALGLHGLARVELERGNLDSAETTLRHAIGMLEGRVRPNHRYLLGVRRTLAEVLTARGRHEEAEALFRGVLAMQRDALPRQHVDVARTLHGYGVLRLAMHNPQGAEPLLREALAMRRVLQPAHWHGAETASALGAALAAVGRDTEADSLLRRGYETLRARRGVHDRRTREARARLASTPGG